MHKFCFIFLLLFVFTGCASMRYVDPGERPAYLTVHARASLEPVWVDDFMNTQVLSAVEQQWVKWYGHLEGPWWAIKAYQRDGEGNLQPLRPARGGIFEGVVAHEFAGSRELVLPPGSYSVEVWLEAYMYYCIRPAKRECGTPTLRIWSMRLEQNYFAPGSRLEVTLDALNAGKGSSGPVTVR